MLIQEFKFDDKIDFMCGRFVINIPLSVFIKFFGISEVGDVQPRFNVAPTQSVPVIREASDGSRRLSAMRWGLVPAWAKEFGDGLINARAETVNEKPSFRQAFRQRRCIIPASGFYEWQKHNGKKIPHYVKMSGDVPMPFAGLWESWRSPEGQVLESCAILTTAANPAIAPIHDRMPVILHPDEFSLWLDREVHEADRLAPLFAPYPADRLEVYPVSSLVNSPANDAPSCIDPV